MVAALAAVAALLSGCGASARSGPQRLGSSRPARCTPAAAQQDALDALRAKGIGPTGPAGLTPVRTVERTADCTSDWPAPHGYLPPVQRFAAVEADYTSSRPLTSAELVAAFGPAVTAAGWQPNGGWDDTQGDGSAYANYCQEIKQVWSTLSLYRGPAAGTGQYPVQVVIEAHPHAASCPGRPRDG